MPWQFVVPAQVAHESVFEMTIGVDLRIVAEEHKEIRVPAVREIRLRVLAEVLLGGAEPGLDPLPRRIGSVELVRAVWPVAVGKQKSGRAELRFDRTQRAQGQVAIIAVRYEAGREVSRRGDLQLPP